MRPVVVVGVDSTSYLLPWYIPVSNPKVLLKPIFATDIVPITLNDRLSGEGIAEILPAPAHSPFLRASLQRTQETCVRYSAAIDLRALLVCGPLSFSIA